MESAIHRAKKEALERDALANVRHEEHMKRSKGKKAWYPKKGVHVTTSGRVSRLSITPSRRARDDQAKGAFREHERKGDQKDPRKETKENREQREEGTTFRTASADNVRRAEEGLGRRSGRGTA